MIASDACGGDAIRGHRPPHRRARAPSTSAAPQPTAASSFSYVLRTIERHRQRAGRCRERRGHVARDRLGTRRRTGVDNRAFALGTVRHGRHERARSPSKVPRFRSATAARKNFVDAIDARRRRRAGSTARGLGVDAAVRRCAPATAWSRPCRRRRFACDFVADFAPPVGTQYYDGEIGRGTLPTRNRGRAHVRLPARSRRAARGAGWRAAASLENALVFTPEGRCSRCAGRTKSCVTKCSI